MAAVVVDTNVLLRYLRGDHPTFFKKAREIFRRAEDGKIELYFDQTMVAETVWVLLKTFDTPRSLIVGSLGEIISQDWVKSPDKKLLMNALKLFLEEDQLSYVDCWLACLGKKSRMKLETFDKKLQRIVYESKN